MRPWPGIGARGTVSLRVPNTCNRPDAVRCPRPGSLPRRLAPEQGDRRSTGERSSGASRPRSPALPHPHAWAAAQAARESDPEAGDPCITALGAYPRRTSPIDSADEPHGHCHRRPPTAGPHCDTTGHCCRVARGGCPPPAPTEPDLWISHPALRVAGVRGGPEPSLVFRRRCLHPQLSPLQRELDGDGGDGPFVKLPPPIQQRHEPTLGEIRVA